MMSNRWHLMRVEQAAAELSQTPAAQALALDLASRMDLLRLKAVARLPGGAGVPPGLKNDR